jgi:hypothetical protein
LEFADSSVGGHGFRMADGTGGVEGAGMGFLLRRLPTPFRFVVYKNNDGEWEEREVSEALRTTLAPYTRRLVGAPDSPREN